MIARLRIIEIILFETRTRTALVGAQSKATLSKSFTSSKISVGVVRVIS